MTTEEAYELLQEALRELKDGKQKEQCSLAIEELYQSASQYDELCF